MDLFILVVLVGLIGICVGALAAYVDGMGKYEILAAIVVILVCLTVLAVAL